MTAKLQVISNSVAEIALQKASLEIWGSKYRLKTKHGEAIDDTIDATYKRVARALAEVETGKASQEHYYQEFLWALRHGAIPAGRIISNAGARQHKPATSTINCTVSGMIADSMDAILDKVHEAGLTLKAGCGIGYEFSTLRPKGAYVSGAGAYTSGPLSFMDIYDRMCFTVSSAGGRRGAQMATFDIGHPDVIEFIRAKRENGRLRQFNLSLLITSEFMEAVKHDREWPLAFPVTEAELQREQLDVNDRRQIIWREFPDKNDYIVNSEGLVACKISRIIPARRLWDIIMSSTYDYAEPGFILIDRVNDMNNNWFCENIRATNPCVTADTWVQTGEGPRQVRELIGASFEVLVDGQCHSSGPEGFFRTAAARKVVDLLTVEGHRLRLTPDHRVRRVTRFTRGTMETDWCEAGRLRAGDRVLLHDHRTAVSWTGNYTREQGYLLGLLMGDGTLKKDKAVLSVWKPAVAANGSHATLSRGVEAVMQEALMAARTLPHRSDFTGWHEISGRNEYRLSTGALRTCSRSLRAAVSCVRTERRNRSLHVVNEDFEHRPSTNGSGAVDLEQVLKGLAGKVGMSPGNKCITPAMERASSDFYRGFLRGLFDADGSVQGSQSKGVSIRLAQSDLARLEAVQRMLLRLCVNSRIYKNRRRQTHATLPDGRGGSASYEIKPQHELLISGENLRQYEKLIGFGDSDKTGRLQACLAGYRRRLNRERFVARVERVVDAGVEDVYDVQVPGNNSFDANGLHAHNCGEQPLPPYGSCLLGSINLTRFVQKPFTSEACFDWENYRKVIRIFTRMLDNVVEIHGLPLPEQAREITHKRRHGMGFLGLGSALTMLRMKYGDVESLQFTEQVSRTLAVEGWQVGLELAREKGPAPVMEQLFTVTGEMLHKRPEMIEDGYQIGDQVPGRVLHGKYSRYMQQLAKIEPELMLELVDTGSRFSHHSSIAPTGTISLSLANNASNGIEPSFAHHYFRNVIREGKKTKQKIDVFSFELLAYRNLVDAGAMPDSDVPGHRLPEYFITAEQVTPRQHVDIQAAAQKWIDASISKTANVPTDYPFEDFKSIYEYAYDRGLKGCTTFRFNPEAFQGVLVKQSDLENTSYQFTLEDGQVITLKGDEKVEYDGEIHTAANLFDALKEGYYGKF